MRMRASRARRSSSHKQVRVLLTAPHARGQRQAKDLLFDMLPKMVAAQIRDRQGAAGWADQFSNVSILVRASVH